MFKNEIFQYFMLKKVERPAKNMKHFTTHFLTKILKKNEHIRIQNSTSAWEAALATIYRAFFYQMSPFLRENFQKICKQSLVSFEKNANFRPCRTRLFYMHSPWNYVMGVTIFNMIGWNIWSDVYEDMFTERIKLQEKRSSSKLSSYKFIFLILFYC